MQHHKLAYSLARMNTLSERLKAARKHAGLTQKQLAEKAGVEQPLISQLETGKNSQSVHLIRLASVCGVSALWLESGAGDMTASKPFIGVREEAKHYGSGEGLGNVLPMLQPTRQAKEYPLISWVAAGARAESPDNYEPGDAEEWLQSTENAGPGGYWLQVKGKSMVSDTPPSFPEGTPILVQPEGFDLISGKFYIFKHLEGETTFKQFNRDAGRSYLTPLNSSFEQQAFDDQWRAIGRVIDAKITGL